MAEKTTEEAFAEALEDVSGKAFQAKALKVKEQWKGLATEAQLAQWQQEHGHVHELIVPLNDAETEFAVGYLRPVTLPAISQFQSVPPEKTVTQAKVILDHLWLGGYAPICTDPQLLMAATLPVLDLLRVRRAWLKK